jgi:GT2 family glycosyltransferase/glycosyltransferase involved in cell wall biosynthesis
MTSLAPADVYGARYFAHSCGRPYQRDDVWLAFFGAVAERIVTEVNPRSVLDAGCAMGFLVEGLRERGVEAFGVDISAYAIDQAHPSIAPFVRVGSITEPFGRRYDLITCIEVLEHLPPDEGRTAIANLCAHTDDILFSSTPLDYSELTHANVQPPEYWTRLFLEQGFYRDLDFDATVLTPWATRYRRSREPVARLIAAYERRLWRLHQENAARHAVHITQHNELLEREATIQALRQQLETQAPQRVALEQELQSKAQEIRHLSAAVAAWELRWQALERSIGGRLLFGLQQLRAGTAPPGSVREALLEQAFWWWQHTTRHGLRGAARQLRGGLRRRARASRSGRATQLWALPEVLLAVPPVQDPAPVAPHEASVDIVVCVHDALEDVRCCLESVLAHSGPPYRLILVDDGSGAPTAELLAAFAAAHGCTLLRREVPTGYTRAANRGLRAATAEHVILLNSDTVVTDGWLDRLVACAESDPQIGLVGPLSNTASWQSIPEVEADGDWAANPLPEGLTVEELAALVAATSARMYPEMAFLNGFCLLIRRPVIEAIGLFDEERFGEGYGEENDYALRARAAGWRLALADDTYIHHSQSRSYRHEQRQVLAARADTLLVEKHDPELIRAGVARCRDDRVLAGIRAHSRVLPERRAFLERGRAAFAGRRVLFLLPIEQPGGGGNVVLREAEAMRAMGVAVSLFNLAHFRASFERAYPEQGLPVIYGTPADVVEAARGMDAVVATVYSSAEWLATIADAHGEQGPALGYYIQDFEPYFYDSGSDPFHRAWRTYTLLPNIVRFTKTEWNRAEIEALVGVPARVVGASLDVDLFRPRPRLEPSWPDRPLRVAAMIRPPSPYRSPRLTMELLQAASTASGPALEVILFGADADDPGFRQLPRDFPYQLAGVLDTRQVARLLNEADLFVDFSTHQAMGLTAMEAMGCGAAVVVTQRGGTGTFARHEANCLAVDPSDPPACQRALHRLITDDELRLRLQRQASYDICAFFPERPAFNTLAVLLGGELEP